MTVLYLECSMGAAGDMLSAALLDALEPDQANALVERLNTMGLDGVEYRLGRSVKCGIEGAHMTVSVHGQVEGEEGHDVNGNAHDSHEHAHVQEGEAEHHHDSEAAHHYHGADAAHHHHEHRHLEDVYAIVDGLDVPEHIKDDAKAVYGIIADAESRAHGVCVSEVHFHEVGALDAIADVVAVCMLIDAIGPEEITVSPVHVGSGTVECAHGTMPVPAPATAHILRDAPIYGGEVEGELCTPTGAALLVYFADRYGNMPVMKVSSIGYGMGTKDFARANCVRAMIGETPSVCEQVKPNDQVVELACTIDDMTAEELSYALEAILRAGALDAFIAPCTMKKSRPGMLFSVLARPEDAARLTQLVFQLTTTIGVREYRCERYALDRSIESVETPYGLVRRKVSQGFGVLREKWEYDDVARIAAEQGASIREIRKSLN